MILILDFGSQYTQLIARRIRESGVSSKILNYDAEVSVIKNLLPSGIILSGGPGSIYDVSAPQADKSILEIGLPILGICYGMQWLVNVEGGLVREGNVKEYGSCEFHVVQPDSILFHKLAKNRFLVWMSHSDQVISIPTSYRIIGKSANGSISAIEHRSKKIFGVQFHPEVTHTQYGREILKNFLFEVCNCKKNWSYSLFIKDRINHIKEEVGDNNGVICGVSGGIDSTTTAKLIHEAIKDNLVCVFVENGLTRQGEVEKVKQLFEELKIKLKVVDAKKRFLDLLKGVREPEEKRKKIGREFIKIFEEVSSTIKDKNIKYLAQGTLYPDVIESTSRIGPSCKIKTHHNVGALPKKLKFKLIEPLKDLFKDEVRDIARLLNLPEYLITRHPFPGPGLAVRILGEVTEERLDILKRADLIVEEELHSFGVYDKVWQGFAVLLPLHSVGIRGDSRSVGYVIAVRIVDSVDGMTADYSKLDYELLTKISNRITNSIEKISRVVYDITSKPPATIEWE